MSKLAFKLLKYIKTPKIKNTYISISLKSLSLLKPLLKLLLSSSSSSSSSLVNVTIGRTGTVGATLGGTAIGGEILYINI